MNNSGFLNDCPCLSGGSGAGFGLSSGAGLSACGHIPDSPLSSAHSLCLMERMVSRGGVLLHDGRRYAAAAAFAACIGVAATPYALGDDDIIVVSNATSSGITLQGDTSYTIMSVFSKGVASDTVINDGGMQHVYSSGVASDTDINDGGMQHVYSSGVASDTVISDGGIQYVYLDGVASDTVINDGGIQYVMGDNDKKASANGTVINYGGIQEVSGGGVASDTVIISRGLQHVFSGGVANGTDISDYGWQTVYSGAVASDTVLRDGGAQVVEVSGVASGTRIGSGGLLQTGSGGSVVSLGSPVSGVLEGFGTVSGNVVIASGGAIAPGGAYSNSGGFDYGSMSVSGNVTISSGGALMVRTDYTGSGGSKATDSLVVDGSATFASGAEVRHVAAGDGNIIDLDEKWTIATASAGISGAADSLSASSNLVFLKPILEADNANLFMSFERVFIFTDFGDTPNQIAVGGGLDSLDPKGPLASLIISNVTGGTDVPRLYDQLSGEMHASLAGGLMLMDRDFSQWILNRFGRGALARTILSGCAPSFAVASIPPRALECRRPNNFWADVGYARQGVDGDGNAGRYSLKGPEVTIGYDYAAASGWLGGAAFRYGDREMKVDSRRSKADIDSYSFALHGGFQTAFGPGAARVVFGGAYTRHNVDGNRSVDIGAVAQRLRSDYHANSYQLFMEGAYAIPVGQLWVEPFLNLDWTSMRVPGFTEKGGKAALRTQSQSQNNLSQLLGVRLTLPAFCRLDLEAQVGWRHTYGKLDKTHAFSFAEGGNRFGIKGAKLNRNEAVFDLRAAYRVNENFRLGVEGAAAVGERGNSVRGGAFIAVEW